MATRHTFEPSAGPRRDWWDRIPTGSPIGVVREPADVEPPMRTRGDSVVVALTLLIGLGEAMSSGLGWPWLRLPAVEEIRAVSPSQSLVFAVSGDLAARSGSFLLDGFNAIDDSYVAAWWSLDVPPTRAEIEVLRAGGVTFFDVGPDVAE